MGRSSPSAGCGSCYGDFEAVRGIEFEVRAGEVFGLLGPNGAGKTTTVEILEGLRQRSSGEAQCPRVTTPVCNPREIKDRIGVCLQATNLPDKIKVHEALALFAAFYSRKTDREKLLERLQLTDKRNDLLLEAVGRSEAARGPGAGAHQRSATGLSRRADHRSRSAGAPRNPQPDPGTARRASARFC